MMQEPSQPEKETSISFLPILKLSSAIADTKINESQLLYQLPPPVPGGSPCAAPLNPHGFRVIGDGALASYKACMSIYDSIDEGHWTEQEFEPYLAACDRIDIALCTLRNHESPQDGKKLSETEIALLLPIMLAEVQRERQTEILSEMRDSLAALRST